MLTEYPGKELITPMHEGKKKKKKDPKAGGRKSKPTDHVTALAASFQVTSLVEDTVKSCK